MMPGRTAWYVAFSLLLVALGIGLFPDVLHFGFASDDVWLIGAARGKPFPIVDQWWAGIAKVPGENLQPSPYYRPLVIFSLYLNDIIGRNNPFGFHLFNLALHVLNSILLFYCLSAARGRFFGQQTAGVGTSVQEFLLAYIFLVHPSSVHNTAWISGRTDLLTTFFSLLATASLLAARKKESVVWLLLPSFFFILALMSKESAIVFPFFIVWMEIIGSWQWEGKGSVLEALRRVRFHLTSFGVIVMLYVALRLLVVGSPLAYVYSYHGSSEILEQFGRQFSILALPVDSMTAYRFYLSYTAVVTLSISLGIIVLGLLIYWLLRGSLWNSLVSSALLSSGVFLLMLFWFPQGGIAQRMVYPFLAWILIWVELSLLTLAKEISTMQSIAQMKVVSRVQLASLLILALIFTWSERWVMSDYNKADSVRKNALATLSSIHFLTNAKFKVIILLFPHALRHSLILGNVDEELNFAETGEFNRLLFMYQGIALVGQESDAFERPIKVTRTSESEFVVEATDESQSLLLRESYYRKASRGESMERRLGRLDVLEVHPYGRASQVRISIRPTLIDSSTSFFAYSAGRFIRLK